MVDPLKIIEKYYRPGTQVYDILIRHSRSVSDLAMKIAAHNSHLKVDAGLLAQAAMLHDIGIVRTHAPDIGCFGDRPYICHGFLGREMLEQEGLHHLAKFCERHTGTGITADEIVKHKLPLPERDMMPVTIEEKILCYADKFFSKTGKNLTEPKKLKKIYGNLIRYGEDKARRFDDFIGMFGVYYVYGWMDDAKAPAQFGERKPENQK